LSAGEVACYHLNVFYSHQKRHLKYEFFFHHKDKKKKRRRKKNSQAQRTLSRHMSTTCIYQETIQKYLVNYGKKLFCFFLKKKERKKKISLEVKKFIPTPLCEGVTVARGNTNLFGIQLEIK